MANEDVTLGELARRMDVLHTDLKELRSAVVERDDLQTVTLGWQAALSAHGKQSELRNTQLEVRVTALENWQTWALRIVMGGVLTAALSFLFVAGK